MDFDKIIGLNFKSILLDKNLYEIEKNESDLELNEGIPEKWMVTAKDNSYEIVLNSENVIETIFIYPNKDNVFPWGDYSVDMGRNEIRKKFGVPDRQGESFESKVLGFNGGYDRFDREIIYHFEYLDKEQKKLKLITLMLKEIAP